MTLDALNPLNGSTDTAGGSDSERSISTIENKPVRSLQELQELLLNNADDHEPLFDGIDESSDDEAPLFAAQSDYCESSKVIEYKKMLERHHVFNSK